MKNKNNEQIRKHIFFISWIMAICMMLSATPLIADEKPVPQNQPIIMGTELDYSPYSMLDEKGNPTGFNVELTQAIAEVMKLDIEIKIGPWGKIRKALETGEIDAISGMYYSEKRDKFVDFSSPYLIINHAIFARSDSPVIDSVNNLRNKEIIVMRGDIMHDFVLKNNISTNLILVNTQPAALRLLASGRHDYALLAKLPGMYYINNLNLNNLVSTGPLLCPSKYCFAVEEGNISTLSQLSEGLAIIKETGRYNEIYNKWLGVLEPKGIARKIILKYVAIIFILLLVLAGIVIFWTWTLRRQITIKTKDLNREITERKQAKEALLESEEKYRLIVENAHDGIEITQNDQIIFANARFAEMLGYTIDELKNLPFYRIYTEQASRKLNERTRNRQAGKPVPYQYETTFMKKDKTVIDVEVKYEIVDYKNKSATFAIIRDITKRKKIEEKNEKQRIANLVILNDLNKTTKDLKAALEKATESDRLKSAFLANMSHEIRTPMNGILGFVQLLKTRKLSGEDQKKYIGIIEKSGDRLLNIINDLINISKLESGQMDISISETNINKQIEYIYTFFKPEVEKKGMQISFKNGLPNDQSFIDTDREKIYAILTNLVKNAIKYSNEGFIEFGYVKKENNLEFFVKDTGIGIPVDKQQVIFERFIQADLTLSSPYQGAGLGLSITKAYVEMLGGKIRVESQEGVGSQFYFTIPYLHKTEISVSKNKFPEIKQEQSNKILKIMIVEDEKATDVYLSIVVKDISKEILHAKTGAEALELFRNNQDIDLILMDIKMPDMDGYDVTRKIREFNKDIIIIAQTAYALAGDREKALEAGCDDHITKPIEKDNLMKMIKKHLKV